MAYYNDKHCHPMTPLYLAYDYADTIQLNSSLNDLGTEIQKKIDFCVVVVKTLYEIWGRDGLTRNDYSVPVSFDSRMKGSSIMVCYLS